MSNHRSLAPPPEFLKSVGLRWGPIMCISNIFPGDADASSRFENHCQRHCLLHNGANKLLSMAPQMPLVKDTYHFQPAEPVYRSCSAAPSPTSALQSAAWERPPPQDTFHTLWAFALSASSSPVEVFSEALRQPFPSPQALTAHCHEPGTFKTELTWA